MEIGLRVLRFTPVAHSHRNCKVPVAGFGLMIQRSLYGQSAHEIVLFSAGSVRCI